MLKNMKQAVFNSMMHNNCHHLDEIFKYKKNYICKSCGQLVKKKHISPTVKITIVNNQKEQDKFNDICKVFGVKF